jgi:hypothetical protein
MPWRPSDLGLSLSIEALRTCVVCAVADEAASIVDAASTMRVSQSFRGPSPCARRSGYFLREDFRAAGFPEAREETSFSSSATRCLSSSTSGPFPDSVWFSGGGAEP